MDIEIQELHPDMALNYVDFFDNRAFYDGNIIKDVIVCGITGQKNMNMSEVSFL